MIQGYNTMLTKISDEELAELPLSFYEGVIHVVENPEDLEMAIEYLEHQTILGFDTETRPAFKKGQFFPVSLLQLSTTDRAFLFRINKIGLPDGIVRILSSPKIIKAGVAIRDDIKILQKVTPFKASGFVELQEMVKDYGIDNYSLKKLSAIVLGFKISKTQRLTNWDAPELTEQQLIYGATDAWVSCEIYKKLLLTPKEREISLSETEEVNMKE